MCADATRDADTMLPAISDAFGVGQIMPNDYLKALRTLLGSDLDFRRAEGSCAAHGIHAFGAKFPPALPRMFIAGLTKPGEVVLDPMAGSGTTVLEACLLGRHGIGLDIDPLALRIAAAKMCMPDAGRVREALDALCAAVSCTQDDREEKFKSNFDEETWNFINYWFLPAQSREILLIKREIDKIKDDDLRLFLEISLSSVIIAKRGGCSLALDLAHTRPHRAKVAYDERGNLVFCTVPDPNAAAAHQRKVVRPVLAEFRKRALSNVGAAAPGSGAGIIVRADARRMPLTDDSVDLIVTSPPYAAGAIDYMRAHKFSLIWLGYSLADLRAMRGRSAEVDESCAGSQTTRAVLAALGDRDKQKAKVVGRYYEDMAKVLAEVRRVLRPGRGAVFVVGNSVIRGVDLRIADCFAELGERVGLCVAGVGVRRIDRDRRMLPVSAKQRPDSQIEKRMMEEHVIGFYKPLVAAASCERVSGHGA